MMVPCAYAISPPSGSSRPASRLSSVVLPAPLGPTRPMRSCASTRKETPCRISSAPYDFVRSVITAMDMALFSVRLDTSRRKHHFFWEKSASAAQDYRVWRCPAACGKIVVVLSSGSDGFIASGQPEERYAHAHPRGQRATQSG